MAMSLLPPGGSPRDDYSECNCLCSFILLLHVQHRWLCACFRVQLEGEGTYECSVTGLVFEASERVLLQYSVLSWSKFSVFLRDSWKFAGPIFNVDTVNKDASVLKSIQFPHSICLAGENGSLLYSIYCIIQNDELPAMTPWPIRQCYEHKIFPTKMSPRSYFEFSLWKGGTILYCY